LPAALECLIPNDPQDDGHEWRQRAARKRGELFSRFTCWLTHPAQDRGRAGRNRPESRTLRESHWAFQDQTTERYLHARPLNELAEPMDTIFAVAPSIDEETVESPRH
jgi:hypothetical protein